MLARLRSRTSRHPLDYFFFLAAFLADLAHFFAPALFAQAMLLTSSLANSHFSHAKRIRPTGLSSASREHPIIHDGNGPHRRREPVVDRPSFICIGLIAHNGGAVNSPAQNLLACMPMRERKAVS